MNRSAGFTMIEMLVSLAILILLATVILSSHTNFTNSIILSNTAYDVALSMHDAESYGIGSRGYGSTINTGYGLYFSMATPTTYLFFADTDPNHCSGTDPRCKPGDGQYTPNDALISTYHLGAGISVSKLCGVTNLNSTICSNGSGAVLDIVFTRPNPNPSLYFFPGGPFGYVLVSTCAVLSSQGGTYWYVSVSQTGLISVSGTAPAACS